MLKEVTNRKIEKNCHMQSPASEIIPIISNVSYRDHTSRLFKQLKCLKFEDLENLNIGIVMFKAKFNKLPGNVQNLFHLCNEIHGHQTRATNYFHIVYKRTVKKAYSISWRGPSLHL